MISQTLNLAYEAATAQFGQEAADNAIEVSIEVFNTNAIDGASKEQCEVEQLEAFRAYLESDER